MQVYSVDDAAVAAIRLSAYIAFKNDVLEWVSYSEEESNEN